MSGDLARAAREGVLDGDLRPVAEWLRTLGSFTAMLLAEAIERGDVMDIGPAKHKQEFKRWEVGRWISQQMATETKYECAVEEAASRFAVSKRTAERCKAEWEAWGADAVKALRFLAGPPTK